MGMGASTSKTLATTFSLDGGASAQGAGAGADGSPRPGAKRGPLLGSVLVPGPEAGSWRLTMVAPLRLQVFDAHTAVLLPLEDASVTQALKEGAPFTAFAATEASAPGQAVHQADDKCYLAIGCQDGIIFVFYFVKGTVHGPLHTLSADAAQRSRPPDAQDEQEGDQSMTQSITVLRLHGDDLFSGSCGVCHCWDMGTSELRRDFPLPGNGQAPATPTSMVMVQASGTTHADDMHLWVGLDNGTIAVFNVQTGVLARTLQCAGAEAVTALASFTQGVFVLSAHRRVSVWSSSSFACLQKYPAELMTCGSDLCSMIAVKMRDPDLALIMLAGVDGSLCVRKVSLRADGKMHCVLLCYMDFISGDMEREGCPITALGYHPETDSVLVGDAGCNVNLVGKLREQIDNAVRIESDVAASMQRDSQGPAAAGGAAAQDGDDAALAGGAPEPGGRQDAPSPEDETIPSEARGAAPREPGASQGEQLDEAPEAGGEGAGASGFPVFSGSG